MPLTLEELNQHNAEFWRDIAAVVDWLALHRTILTRANTSYEAQLAEVAEQADPEIRLEMLKACGTFESTLLAVAHERLQSPDLDKLIAAQRERAKKPRRKATDD